MIYDTMVPYVNMTELWQPFNLDEDHSTEDLYKTSALLQAVRGSHPNLTSREAILDDLTTYDTFLGGKLGAFSVHRDEIDVIRALAYVVRYQDSIELVALSVDKEKQCRGLGARVLGELITESEQNQVPIWLHTGRGNRGAQRFFGRAGFDKLPESDFRQNPDSKFVALERVPVGE